MKKVFSILLLCVALITSVHAEVIVLRSGKTIKGEILLSNDEVVIVRQKDGTRFQIPTTEVLRIATNDTNVENTGISSQTKISAKKVAMRMEIGGGAAYLPYQGWGGATQVDVMLGSHNLLNRQIFLGGSIGYHGVFVLDQSYSWIPLRLAVQVPVLLPNTRLCPTIGGNIGYAFATNEDWGSGMCAGVNMGGRYTINERSSMTFAFKAQWLQTRIDVTENIQGIDYQNHIGVPQITLGASLGIQF